MDLPTPHRAFEIAGGSVAGRSHVAAGRNNQDAFAWAQSEHGAIAVVCDGCGSGAHSEIGSKIGSNVILQAGLPLLGQGLSAEEILERVRVQTLGTIDGISRAMSGSNVARTIVEHFLFTVVGLLVEGEVVTPFSIGDGLIVINGRRTELGPFPNNEPPYLTYALLSGSRAPRFEVHPSLPYSSVESLLLATDGALELDSIASFWEDDRVFRNPDMVRRRLAVAQRERRLLSDDTTLVVARPCRRAA